MHAWMSQFFAEHHGRVALWHVNGRLQMMVEDQYLQPGSVAWVTESRAEPACGSFIGDVCIPGDWCRAMSQLAPTEQSARRCCSRKSKVVVCECVDRVSCRISGNPPNCSWLFRLLCSVLALVRQLGQRVLDCVLGERACVDEPVFRGASWTCGVMACKWETANDG